MVTSITCFCLDTCAYFATKRTTSQFFIEAPTLRAEVYP